MAKAPKRLDPFEFILPTKRSMTVLRRMFKNPKQCVCPHCSTKIEPSEISEFVYADAEDYDLYGSDEVVIESWKCRLCKTSVRRWVGPESVLANQRTPRMWHILMTKKRVALRLSYADVVKD